MNDIELYLAPRILESTKNSLAINDWGEAYRELLGPPYEDEAKWNLVAYNPYYAAINATAFVLMYGNFRGYDHLRATYFEKDSKYWIGLCIEHERTRTDMDNGRYVSDWYIKPEFDNQEMVYKAAYILLTVSNFTGFAPFPPYLMLRKYSEAITHSIRLRDDFVRDPETGYIHADKKALNRP